ncbi:DegV family protein [Alteribacillus sp. HJP-4]|uniref:DegV family protein n=1 Tax=Alteribacillus sp. HJP-4 TaxID=2775394 RepID=UPI0035CCDAC9
MPNIAIVTDSTAYLPPEQIETYGITVVPLSVVFEESAFEEEIEMSTADFYEKMKKADEHPTTSQPSPGKFLATYERLAENHDAIISIHLSSGISGTYQTALAVAEDIHGAEVYCFDSEISCMVQGFYVLEAARLAMEEATVDDILDRLEEMKKTVRAYFMVENLNHLHRGGRLSGAQAMVGSLLQIKPVLHFENKLIVPFEKVRTEKKAVNRILELFHEDAGSGEAVKATVIHANRPEKADKLRSALIEKYPHAEVDVSYFGPVIGTHLGERSLGLGWYKP